MLDEERRYNEALTYLEKAHATYPEEIIYLANTAEIFYKLKAVQQAIAYAKECEAKSYISDIIRKVLSHEHISTTKS
ncbi:hypothetical protein C9994_03140 [Marivirga lumbricoides]|uniref:Tetratricopeptide repeat protein n=1 Tax=Marivirga lumbricoides TaxID=1046115 RepID=A0A2T4DU96_9BACT|nr:hypothetical protein C9994_03140 [Marivirga lumbricoides]